MVGRARRLSATSFSSSSTLGQSFIEFGSFQDAYEALKQETDAFVVSTTKLCGRLSSATLVFVVVRTILGVSPPEWAELGKAERDVDVTQRPI
jgi:hypothetical protein